MCSALYLNASEVLRRRTRLAADEQHSKYVTQSISLSNINASSIKKKPSPEAHETCR
jgi:hypothetical protein